ncbi:MAG: hypothetical protein LVS60_11560 [Nodosilinea sp. LVE1205-7]
MLELTSGCGLGSVEAWRCSSMAKRRNPKKEKALRNQAYARKFRKKRAGNQRFFKRNSRGGDDEGAESKESSDYSAAAL